MRGYHAIASMLWKRDSAQIVHMTNQAIAVGVSGRSSNSLPITASDADKIVGDVVAGLMDKWRLSEDQKRDLERLSQAKDKIQPSANVYAAIPDRSAKNKLQAAVMYIGKHIEYADKAVRDRDKRAADTSRGLARKKLMGLIETLAVQSKLSGYTNGLTEAHKLLAVA